MGGERKFIEDNVKRALLREYLKEQVKRAGFGGADIQRTPMGTRVTLITERPGLVIGRKGSSIKALTDAIEFDFGFNKPQVEVVEVENATLSAQIMAEKLASALERGWHFRRAGHSTVRRIMENGAKGCQVIISGKLTGQRHRTEKFKEGHIKFCGEPKLQWMEEGYTPAKLKAGVIGCKVQIMHPNARLPDEVNIIDEKAAALIPDVEKPVEKPVKVETPEEDSAKKEELPEAIVPTEQKEPSDKVEEKKAPAEKKADKPKEELPTVDKPKEELPVVDKPKAEPPAVKEPKAEEPKPEEPKDDKEKQPQTDAKADKEETVDVTD